MLVEILDCVCAATIAGTGRKHLQQMRLLGVRECVGVPNFVEENRKTNARSHFPLRNKTTTKNPNCGRSFSGSRPESRRRGRDDAGRGGFTARLCEGDEKPGNIIVQKSREQCGISCLTSWDQTPLSGHQTSAAYLKRGLEDGEAVVRCLGAA